MSSQLITCSNYMISVPQIFHLFLQLPIEIRLQIWKLCIPSRVVELDEPSINVIQSLCELRQTAQINARRPLIAQVCHESRELVFSHRGMITYEGGPTWVSSLTLINQWYNPALDIVHLNWTQDYWEDYDGEGQPLLALRWAAKEARGTSFMCHYLLPFDIDTNVGIPSVAFEDLVGGKSYLVCLKTIFIHVPRKTAMEYGIFGMFAEECVKIVNALDTKSIKLFHQLYMMQRRPDSQAETNINCINASDWTERVEEWSANLETLWFWHKWQHFRDKFPGIEEPTDIWLPLRSVPSLSAVSFALLPGVKLHQLRVNKTLTWVQKLLESMPKFQPTIIFRFCESDCLEPIRPLGSKEWWEFHKG